MQERSVTIPELMLIAGTRVALGAGVGLLVGEKLPREARKSVGWALLSIGVLTTIPIVIGILSKPQVLEKKAA